MSEAIPQHILDKAQALENQRAFFSGQPGTAEEKEFKARAHAEVTEDILPQVEAVIKQRNRTPADDVNDLKSELAAIKALMAGGNTAPERLTDPFLYPPSMRTDIPAAEPPHIENTDPSTFGPYGSNGHTEGQGNIPLGAIPAISSDSVDLDDGNITEEAIPDIFPGLTVIRTDIDLLRDEVRHGLDTLLNRLSAIEERLNSLASTKPLLVASAAPEGNTGPKKQSKGWTPERRTAASKAAKARWTPEKRAAQAAAAKQRWARQRQEREARAARLADIAANGDPSVRSLPSSEDALNALSALNALDKKKPAGAG